MSQVSRTLEKYGRDQLIEVYHNGGRKALSEFTELPYNSVGHLCKSLGVYNREEYIHQKDRQFSERWKSRNPFEGDSDTKWYLVGYFLGDGSLRRHHGRLYASIASSDEQIIHNISNLFDNLSWEYNKGCYQITTGDAGIISTLISLGFKERKSYVGWDWCVPDEWLYSFLRGLLDSDGTVKKPSSSNTIAWYGHESYIRVISNIFSRPCKKMNSYCEVSIHKRETLVNVINKMYDNQSICLERKRERCYQILNR